MCGSLGACASGGPYVENGPHGSTDSLRFRSGRRGSGRHAPREAAFVNALRTILEWVRESPVLATLVALLIGLLVVFVVVGVFDPTWIYGFFGVETKTGKFRILEFIGVGMGGVLLAIGATIAHRRARAMEDAANAQAKAANAQAQAAAQQTVANRGAEDGRRQERLKNAIEHLGHESDSVRLGGAYELFHLARDTEYLRQTVLDILCAHIRRTTGEAGYREEHKSKPSEEVQSLLTLLFRQEHAVFRGCRIDLQESWLNGAMLDQARLQEAALTVAQLQGADLQGVQLQGADLQGAQLQGVDFYGAQLQGVDLQVAQLQGANLRGAQLQGADFHGAQLQGADLQVAYLQGANLREAHLQGVNLFGVRLQRANLAGARLQGATCQPSSHVSLKERICEGIDRESDLSGVTFVGGLRREDVDSFVQDLPGEKVEWLRDILAPHVGRPESHELPQRSGAIIGSYTEEEAERWIAEYAEATGESPEAGG